MNYEILLPIVLIIAAISVYYFYPTDRETSKKQIELPDINYDNITTMTLRKLINKENLDEIPSEFNQYTDYQNIATGKPYLFIPCLYVDCEPNTFFLFLKLKILYKDLTFDPFTEIPGKKEYVIKYTIEGTEYTVKGELTEEPILVGIFNSGTIVNIKVHYQVVDGDNIRKSKETEIITIMVPQVDNNYCQSIPYKGRKMFFSNNQCVQPTDQRMMYQCLTKRDPLRGNIDVWSNKENKCVNLQLEKPVDLKEKCNIAMSRFRPEDYCGGQSIPLGESIRYKCDYPKAGNIVYDQNKFYNKFDEPTLAYWTKVRGINTMERIWEKVYECEKDYDGSTIATLPCLTFADEERQKICLDYQKEKFPNCHSWDFHNGDYICDKCKPNYYGKKCTRSLLDEMKKYPNCTEWMFQGGQFMCKKCRTGYYDETDKCQFEPTSIMQQHPNCLFQYAGDGKFTCYKCKEGYYDPKKMCTIQPGEDLVGCETWELVNDKLECSKCKDRYFGEKEGCIYSLDEAKLENPNCLEETLIFNVDTFDCGKCQEGYFGKKCEHTLDQINNDYPNCTGEWSYNMEKNQLECTKCEVGFQGDRCEGSLHDTYPNCTDIPDESDWALDEESGEIKCKQCDDKYKGDKCELAKCTAFDGQVACKDQSNCQFMVKKQSLKRLDQKKFDEAMAWCNDNRAGGWNGQFCKEDIKKGTRCCDKSMSKEECWDAYGDMPDERTE